MMTDNTLCASSAASLSADIAAQLAPLTSASLFWQPKFLGEDPILAHVPFLFWLVEATRPRSILTLGLGGAAGYFALAQAAERIGLSAVCQAITDSATPHLAAHLAYNAATYPDAASIAVGDPLKAAEYDVPPGSVDLMLLQLPLNGEAGDRIAESWLPRLSETGVILVAGAPPAEGPLADAFAQVARRLMLEPAAPNSIPLSVLLIGPRQSERLDLLAQLRLGMPGHAEMRRVFARLGQATLDARAAQAILPIQPAASEASTAELVAALALADAAKRAAADLRTSLEAARISEAAARTHLGRALVEVGRLARLLAESQDTATAAAETAETAQRRAILAEAALTERSAALMAAEDRSSRLEAALAATKARVAALEGSTSWRLTAPLRGAVLLMRRG